MADGVVRTQQLVEIQGEGFIRRVANHSNRGARN